MQSELINIFPDIINLSICKLIDASKLLKSSFIKFKSLGLYEFNIFPV